MGNSLVVQWVLFCMKRSCSRLAYSCYHCLVFLIGLYALISILYSITGHPSNRPVDTTRFAPLMCKCKKGNSVPTDESSRQTQDRRFDWCSKSSTARGPNQRVIAYTLYGDATDPKVFLRYFSWLRNISVTAQSSYPGWIVRIYHNIQMGEEIAGTHLCNVYCHSINMDFCSVPWMVQKIRNSTSLWPVQPELLAQMNPRMYRYLAMMDPNVDVVISRDIDSLILPREVDAVKQWLDSDYTFHVMRDSVDHSDIVLAGMFGVKIDKRRDLIEGLTRILIVSGQNLGIYHDQNSLNSILWPVAQWDVMAHDSYQCENPEIIRKSPLRAFPFPTQRKGNNFVGQIGIDSTHVMECPLACRPKHHPEWEFC